MISFLCLEGLDGSGKSTQIDLLKHWLENNGIKFKYLHFPKTDYFPYGEMIAKFLRGEFGHINEVDPHLVALIYALDRKYYKPIIEKWLSDGFFVLLDRYVYSNVAFQAAKIGLENEKEDLRKWIYRLEFDHYRIPRPDISIFLNAPIDFVSNSLSIDRMGKSREYLNGKIDIHEDSLLLQKNVQKEYIEIASKNDDLIVIKCYSERNKMMKPIDIHNKIIDVISQS